jgi:hypothetical protein
MCRKVSGKSKMICLVGYPTVATITMKVGGRDIHLSVSRSELPPGIEMPQAIKAGGILGSCDQANCDYQVPRPRRFKEWAVG